MGVENLKRWHWAIIGLLLGAMFGGTRVFWREPDGGNEDRSYDRKQFEAAIWRGMDVRNLVLHPPVDGQEWLSGQGYKLTNGRFGARFMRQRPGATQPAKERPGEWVNFLVLASDPNSKRPIYVPPEPVTGADYLAALQKEHPHTALSYKNAWWEIPKYTVSLYAAGGLVLIGGVFATIVNLLTGAGFGRAKKADDDYDLSRFKSGDSPAVQSEKAQADPSELEQLNARLEENVAGMVMGKTELQLEDEEEEQAIKHLKSEPLDATETEAARVEREAKEYKGEFYPVVKPGGTKGTKP